MKQPLPTAGTKSPKQKRIGIQLAQQVQGEAESRFKVAIAQTQQQSDLRAQQIFAEASAELTEARSQTQPIDPKIIDVDEEAAAQAAASSLGEAATHSDQYLFGGAPPRPPYAVFHVAGFVALAKRSAPRPPLFFVGAANVEPSHRHTCYDGVGLSKRPEANKMRSYVRRVY